jgi:fused signal recognition particle receptor
MARGKELRRQKKRQAQMERVEKRAQTDSGAPEGAAWSGALDRAARKAEKKLRVAEKAREEAEFKDKLKRTREEAEQTRQALEAEEEALREREAVLTRELGEEEPDETQTGLFRRLREGISKTRESLSAGLGRILLGKKEIDREVLAGLEEVLITADVGPETTRRLLEAVRGRMRRDEVKEADRLAALVKSEIQWVMERSYPDARFEEGRPVVVLFVGVNGTGKTTTIGKMAHQFTARGKKVLLAAGDTFRAAAGEQLEGWSRRAGCELFRKEAGADPSSVVFQAVRKAMDEGYDLVLCDTAGRLHTKVNLMEELKKVKRVIAGLLPDAPQETLLVLDGNTGQNAIFQTRDFHRAIGVTGLIVTKLDGTARGGVVVGIVNEFDIPIRFVGIGEGVEDLRPFDPGLFAQGLLD